MLDLERFSAKQRLALHWWWGGPYAGRDGILCDGAVRSGKSLCLSLGFLAWSMAVFDGQDFALCGKTIGAVRRNVAGPLQRRLAGLGFACREHKAQNLLEISAGGRCNRYHLFGGLDESSAGLIQGMTLAGVLLDEAALMPRGFVEQAAARCSVEGAKLWLCCNPEHPGHWFYLEWVQRAREKNLLYLHFTMEDNPSLSPAVRRRYQAMYSGAFYRRFVLGQWAAPQGLVYPMFQPRLHVVDQLPGPMERYVISCDYGTVNPCSMGLWGLHQGRWYRMREFYHDARRQGFQLTDEEYHQELERLAGGLPVEQVVVDPSAASFLQCIRRHGLFRAVSAVNQVMPGIQLVGELLRQGLLMFHRECRDILREFALYCWEEGSSRDAPRKEHDHAMDDMRYFAATVLAVRDREFFALAPLRRGG